MSDFLDELEEDGKAPSTNLADVRALAMKQLELEAEVAKHEALLKDAQAALRKIDQGDLPAALKAAGIPSFKLENGMTVSYSEDLKVSVPKASKPAVVAKMREWGYEASVSNVLTVDLGKGNDNAVKSLSSAAEEMGLAVSVSEDIATGTVKKALNARIKEGKSDDLPTFGAFTFTKSTVK